MQILESFLAFAITMLVLSLTCSAFVEIIHRALSMREAGFKYMLEQVFDQVISRYVDTNRAKFPALAQKTLPDIRASFVERMSSNRAPMGVGPNATPTRDAEKQEQSILRLWNGRDLSSLTPNEFMERLGSTDVGAVINHANDIVGKQAAASVDVVLKDIAQKFEAIGNDARKYFEGRARLLSVTVAVALAFAAHVDAIDLFKTYLRDPNARSKVIEQSQAITAQYEASIKSLEEVRKLNPNAEVVPPDEVRKQMEKLRQDALDAIKRANDTVKQYAGLGAPIGWNDERVRAADMSVWIWTCKDETGASLGWKSLWQNCPPDSPSYKQEKLLEEREFKKVWVQIPTSPAAWLYLFLGGLLIGLGSPFWYDAVTGLTNLRNTAKGTTPAQPVPPNAGANAQPITPVGAFKVANAARPA